MTGKPFQIVLADVVVMRRSLLLNVRVHYAQHITLKFSCIMVSQILSQVAIYLVVIMQFFQSQ